MSTTAVRERNLNREIFSMMDKDFSAREVPPKEDKRKIINVKKNYIDPTSGFFYALGCSLVHLSLLITMLTTLRPNIERAKELDLEWQQKYPDKIN